MPTGAVFLILLGCTVGAALASGLRLAGFAVGQSLLPGADTHGAALLIMGMLAGAGGGFLAGGSVAITLRRLLRRPAAAMGIMMLLWAAVTGVDAALWPQVIYKTPMALGVITALVGLAILPMAPRPLSDGL